MNHSYLRKYNFICLIYTLLMFYFLVSQDQHTAAWSLFVSISTAFGFWMDILSSLFVTVITLTFFLYGGKFFTSFIYPLMGS